MGIHRPSRRTRPSRERFLSLTRVAQVVPDVPSFAVDGGFAYRVPPDLIDEVSVGSIVRVPLSGRRVRGYVVDVAEREDEGLKDVRSVSGVWSCFDRPILQTLRWAATHYVAPLSVVIAKTAPPNLPRRAAAHKLPSIPPAFSPIPDVSDAAQSGNPRPADPDSQRIRLARPHSPIDRGPALWGKIGGGGGADRR